MEGGEEEGEEKLLPGECKEPWPLKLSKGRLVNILSKPFLRQMTFGRVIHPDSHCRCLLVHLAQFVLVTFQESPSFECYLTWSLVPNARCPAGHALSKAGPG